MERGTKLDPVLLQQTYGVNIQFFTASLPLADKSSNVRRKLSLLQRIPNEVALCWFDEITVCGTPRTADMTSGPTRNPTLTPTNDPTNQPTITSGNPSASPTNAPTVDTMDPTMNPTIDPSMDPTVDPTVHPTSAPTNSTMDPPNVPTISTLIPTRVPTGGPTRDPTIAVSTTQNQQEYEGSVGELTNDEMTTIVVAIVAALSWILIAVCKETERLCKET
eukprot:93320_1